MELQAGVGSHVGMKRGHNEDNCIALPALGLFAVADGMGGHASGETASKLAIETLAGFFKRTRGLDPEHWSMPIDPAKSLLENRLALGVIGANARVWQANNEIPEHPADMGTTLAVLAIEDGVAFTAHVGDSRVYRHRDGALVQLTEDHSLVNEFLKRGKLKPEEVEGFPHKNVLVRSVGQKAEVDVDIRGGEPVQPGDVFLLCSDGLWNMVNADLIGSVLGRADDLERAAQQLIDLANSFGGTDNVTCVLVKVSP